MDQQAFIVMVLALVCAGALSFVVLAPTQQDKAKKRLEQLDAGARSGVRRATVSTGDRQDQKDRRRRVTEALAKVDAEARKQKKKSRVPLEQKLEQAGLSFGAREYYIGSAAAALLFALLGLISGQKLIITAGLAFIGGVGAPAWFVGFCKNRRQKKFANEFSNAIDVIVRGVKSGLPVNECLKIIAREAPRPVNEEFHQLTEGLRIGLSLEQALQRMHERMPLQEVSFFGIVLMIQQKTGGNLAEALSNLANVLRGRKMMEGKVKALSAEAKASAMIIGALPFLVMGAVKMASPDYLEPLFSTRPGNFILIVAGGWMLTGIMVMRNMIKIKV